MKSGDDVALQYVTGEKQDVTVINRFVTMVESVKAEGLLPIVFLDPATQADQAPHKIADEKRRKYTQAFHIIL